MILVYNPKSGSSKTAKELRELCKANGITLEKLIPLTPSIARTLAPHIKAGKTIAAIGGDGTVSSIAALVVGTKATLAPLPGGTLNHFTKDLGIPQDINDAFARLKTAKKHAIDVAAVNDVVFVNNASFGIYPTSLKVREELEGSLGKWPAAAVGMVSALMRFRIYTVTVNGRTIRTPFVFVGNNDYHLNDVGVMNRPYLDRGVLSVAIIRTTKRLHTMWLATKVLSGTAQKLKEFETLTTDVLTIESKHRKLHVSHDGEVTTMQVPLRFEIKKKSLRVL